MIKSVEDLQSVVDDLKFGMRQGGARSTKYSVDPNCFCRDLSSLGRTSKYRYSGRSGNRSGRATFPYGGPSARTPRVMAAQVDKMD